VLWLQDLKTLRESGATSDPSVDKLHVEVAEAFKQQLQRVVQASKQQPQPDAAGDTSPTPAAAEGTAATPVVRLHRIVIDETDGSDSEDALDHAADARRVVGSSSDDGEVLLNVLPAAAAAAKPQPAAAAGSGRAATGSTQAAGQQAREAEPPAAAAASRSPAHARVLSAPKTATEFLTTAKSLLAPAATTAAAAAVKGRSVGGAVQAQQQEQLAEYIRLLDPSHYAKVFKSGFDANAMPLLLQGLAQISHTDCDFAERGLAALAKVDRFAIVYPMLGKASQGLAADIVGQLQAAGRDVKGLKSSYRL
jgi:hypothetical protein